MQNNSFLPWFFAPLLLLVASLLIHNSPQTTSVEARPAGSLRPSPRSTAAADNQEIPTNGHDAWELLWKFASGAEPDTAASFSKPSTNTGARKRLRHPGGEDRQPAKPKHGTAFLHDRLAAFDTDYIIATVADPIESHAQEDFDRSLEAIQAALAASHYSLSRFDLPWRTPLQEAQLPQDKALPNATLKPGVMLFFNPDSKPNLLLVFIVGEIPTGGIHKTAFLDALRQANEICAVVPCSRINNQGPIRILGPTFSGSAESISMALKESLDEKIQSPVQIISGSATAPNIASDFGAGASFETVVHDDKDTFVAVYDYLTKHCHAQPNEFGILYEEGTGYGSASAEWLKDKLKDKGPTQIPFPFGVSELHRDSQETATTPQPAQTGENGEPGYSVLTPQNAGHDIVPWFSSLKEAIADRALSSAMETIQEMNLKYVGILATNVRDTIFLAQQIRTRIPNIVVFVLDNDSLYLNSEVVRDLTGMLVASTYPLFPTSQLFSGQHKIAFIFSSQLQEGTYNALLALLGNDAAMLDYYHTVSFASDSAKPPVWLTVVGSTEFWPIGAIDSPSTADFSTEKLHAASVAPANTSPSPAEAQNSTPGPAPAMLLARIEHLVNWISPLATNGSGAAGRAKNRSYPSLNDGLEPRILKLLLLFLGALCIYVSLARLFPLLNLVPPLPAGALRKVIPPFRHAQSYYALALLVILGEIFALTSLALWLPVNALPEYFHFPGWAKGIIVLVALVLPPVAAIQGFFALIEFARERQIDQWLAAFIATALPVAWFVMLICFGLAEMTQSEHAVSWLDRAAALRFTNIESGISTFRPLFLIGLAALCVAYGALRRLKLGEQLFANPETGTPRFFGFEESASFHGIADDEDRISDLIRMVSLGGRPGRPWTALLIVLAFVFVWWLFRPLGNRFFGYPWVYSFEAKQFNWLFIIAFLAVYLEIAHSAVRCGLCWHYFHAMLRRLSQSPLVDDFPRIGEQAKDAQDSTPHLQLSMPEATFTSLYLSVEAADDLAQCDAVAPPIRQRAQQLKIDFDTAIRSGRSGCADLVRAMASLAADIGSGLEPFSPLRLSDNPTSDAEKATLYCRRFLATRVVHYCWIMMVEFRNWFIFTGSGLFLMLMAVSSYPFINDDYLLRFSWVALLAAVSSAVALLVQINRDKVLSLLSGGTPGKIDWNWDFMSRLLIYGLLPILGLLGIQFPATLSGISHLIQTAFGGAAGLKG